MLASALLLTLSACASRQTAVEVVEPGERLARAERIASSPTASAAAVARAGLLNWIVAGDGERADVYFQRALDISSNEAMALFGQLLLATERLDEEGVITSSLALVERAPESPLTEIAADWLGSYAGISSNLDEAPLELARQLSDSSLGLTDRSALRLRESLVTFAESRNQMSLAMELRHALGTPTAWTLVGPLHALRISDLDRESPFDDPAHALAEKYDSPVGPVLPKRLLVPNGRVTLDGEPWDADVYEALTDVEVEAGGDHLLSFRGAGMARVWIDGTEVLSRSVVPQRPDERSWGGVRLSEGSHRIRVRFSRAEDSWFALHLSRIDGTPASLNFSHPAVGSNPSPRTPAVALLEQRSFDERISAAAGDEAVAAFIGALARLSDAPEAARERMEEVAALCGEGPAVRMLRGDLLSRHADMPRSLSSGLIARELDDALAKAPWLARAAIHRFEQELRDRRWDDAATRLDLLKEQLGSSHHRVLLSRARLALHRGNGAAARRLADEVLSSDPSRCDALDFRASLARSDREIAVEDALIPRLLACPDGIRAAANYARQRGDLATARRAWEQLIARQPTAMVPRFNASELAFAQGDVEAAERYLTPLLSLWPRSSAPLRQLASIRERAGDPKSAAGLRRKAIEVDGSLLPARLALALDEGTEPVAWARRDGKEVIEAYRANAQPVSAQAVQVLDQAALEVQNDGSVVERVHHIVQVLDKRGIDRWGELKLPGDAHILLLRTVKSDGTILEAEHIAQKDSISMPNLEPGDFVEYEYLRAVGSRGASLPGWQGSSFYFQARELPFYESTYRVRAPAAIGLEVDAHRISDLSPVEQDGEFIVFNHTETKVKPYLREPFAPTDQEVLPWLEVGSGAGQKDSVRTFADFAAVRSRTSPEVREFVRGTRNLPPRERLHALVERAREAVRGDTSTRDFSSSPTTILVNGRGNRLVLLKAAFDEVGIWSRFVLARPFAADPTDYRFPRSDSYPVVVLVAETAEGERVWLDLDSKHAPLNRIRASLSEASGWLVPVPGEEPVPIVLPQVLPSDDRVEAAFELSLTEDGTVEGTVIRSLYGRSGAAVRRQLEKASETEIRRAQERSLGASFRGLELLDLRVEDNGDPESPVHLHATITIPWHAKQSGGSLVLPAHFGASRLGARYLVAGQRETPLVLSSSAEHRISAALRLPPGASVELPKPVRLESPFGTFESQWAIEDGTIRYQENSILERHRIQPEQYGDFQSFVSAIDSAQAGEIAVRTEDR